MSFSLDGAVFGLLGWDDSSYMHVLMTPCSGRPPRFIIRTLYVPQMGQRLAARNKLVREELRKGMMWSARVSPLCQCQLAVGQAPSFHTFENAALPPIWKILLKQPVDASRSCDTGYLDVIQESK